MPFINIPSSGSASWKDAVADPASLPASGNEVGDARVTESTSEIYVWDGSAWQNVGGSASAITALTNDVTATGPGSVAATVAFVGGETAADVATSVQDTQAATDLSTVSTIVKRDASGETSLDGLNLDGSVSGAINIKAADTTTNYTIKMPAAQGGATTYLENDGSGNLSWAAASGGANTSLSNLVSPTAINQNLNLGSNEISQTNYIISPQLYDAGTQTTNFTIDWSNGPAQKLVIDNAGPLAITLSNPVTGGSYILQIEQGTTPGSVTWPASVKWGAAQDPVLSDATGEIDVISLFYDGTNYRGSAIIEDSLAAANVFLNNLQSPTAVSAALLGLSGSVNNPSYSFSGNTGAGMWSASANILNFSTNGIERARIDASGNVAFNTTSTTFPFQFIVPSSTTGFALSAAGELFNTFGAGGSFILRAQTPSVTGGGQVFLGGSARADSLRNVIYFSTNNVERLRILENGGVIINETGTDSDIRIEGDNDANLVFVDASTDKVGIGTNTPAEKLEVNGNAKVSNGDAIIATAGKGLKVATGTNAKMGTAALANVTSVTVNTTAVSTNSLIFVTQQDGGSYFGVNNIVNGTSFDIEHGGGNITATVAWIIIDPA